MEGYLRSSSAPASPKMERKDVEKNRRNKMKNLYNQLYSLLPNQLVLPSLHNEELRYSDSQQEPMTLPDQIDAAIKYIQSSEMKLEKNKMYLEQLRRMNSSIKRNKLLSNSTNEPNPSTKSSPHIQVHEMGPNMVVVLIIGLENLATFNDIIRLCHNEGVEVVSSHFQLNGNSLVHISHETKIKRSLTNGSGATTLCDKLNELLYGSSCSNDMESQLQLWDYVIESGLIEFDGQELLPIPIQNPSMYSYMQNV